MAKKKYRPKANVGEGFTLTVNMGGDPESGGRALDISEWPYVTEDPAEQAVLDARDDVTDRPPPKQEKSAAASGGSEKEDK